LSTKKRRSRDGGSARVLREGTEAHYRDARYYDHAYARRKEDVAFYANLARRCPGPVLELGVGTGRVAIACARAGANLVGVDRMPEMLARAKERLAALPAPVRTRIALIRGDLRTVRLGRRFPLVISPFNVFMHLYHRDDIERALATVRAHLAPGGRFAFDVMLPQPAALARDPARVYKSRPVYNPSDGHKHAYYETFQYDPIRQVQLVTMAFQDLTDRKRTTITPLAHRQFFPKELDALLHYNGFRIEARFGDFQRGPLRGDSESQVVIARVAPRRRVS
jgi:SAM-dependent methyltransferase